jgi:CheY-like chemotaxis protein
MAVKQSILFADDDSFFLKAVCFHLRKKGYKVYTASNGVQATAHLNENEIDLIVSDLNMEKFNGFELASWVRKNIGRTLPIIAVTSFNDRESILNAVRSGINEVLVKPIHPAEICNCVSKHL